MLACERPSGVWGLNLDTGELKPFACGSPRCVGCAPKWGRILKRRIAPILSQIIRNFPADQPLKFGTLTLPPGIDAAVPSYSVVEAENVVWRRFTRYFRQADPAGRVFVWKREVGARGGRLHRHCAIVTKLSNVKLKRLAWRAGAGRIVNFKLATRSALSSYLAKYIAKPGADLNRWPSRTRWAQTIVPKVPFQGPLPNWKVRRFGRFATEREVLAWAESLAAPPPRPQPALEILCQLAGELCGT